ncbi:MAG: hypothetical protein ABL889_12615 [Terricaulis sp.]
MTRPTDEEISAAARVLDKAGRFHRWWPETTPDYEKLDPIGKNEFEAIVEQMLMAAAQVRQR